MESIFFLTLQSDHLPSGEVKNSDVCCVCAYHQVRLAHIKQHWVSLCLGEG